MINGSFVNGTTFDESFPELTWPERGVIFIYILVIFVMSTVGNTFVLCMSKDLKSVTKDSKGATILINVAAIDLATNVFLTFPMLISVLTKYWVFGTFYCFLVAFFETYLGTLMIYFIFIISLQRTIVIRFPFKQRKLVNTKTLWTVIVFGYIFCIIPSIIRTFSTTQIMGYIPEEVHCDNLEAARVQPWQTFLLVSMVIFAAIPILVTVILYVNMLHFAMTRASKVPTLTGKYPMNNGEGRQMKAPNKALHTVSMIVGMYLFSITLTLVLMVVRIRVPDPPKRLQTAAICLWLVNSAVNPIIYIYNNPAFRAHVKRLIQRKRGIYTQNSMVSSIRGSNRHRRSTQQSVDFEGTPTRARRFTGCSSSSSVALSYVGPDGRRPTHTNIHVMTVPEEEQELQLEAGLVIENKLALPNTDLKSDSVTPPPSETGT